MSMKTQIKGRNVTVTPALQEYANEKIAHVHKLLQQRKIDEVTRVELELKVEKNPSIPEPCIAEATVFTRGPVIRARESSTDMYAAIDLVTDKLVRRVKKYHDKIHGKTKHGHDKIVAPTPELELAPVAATAALAEDIADEFAGEFAGDMGHAGDNGRIVKTKQFALKPMSVREATLQLELVGHDFFVFTNAESNRTNVVYRRSDGHYGLIEPAEN
jgi:putative sigma-54 modulation protein